MTERPPAALSFCAGDPDKIEAAAVAGSRPFLEAKGVP